VFQVEQDILQRKMLLLFIITGLGSIGCGSKKSTFTSNVQPALSTRDSMMLMLNKASDAAREARRIVSLKRLQDSSEAQTGGMQRYSQTVLSQTAATSGDTAATLEAAISTGAKVVMVDSGSAEDRRLDSLMMVAASLSDNYRRFVMNHTHKTLAQAAHQDPAKQRRLLSTITTKQQEREEAARRADEARQRRIAERLGR
jgi:hypothetical protein